MKLRTLIFSLLALTTLVAEDVKVSGSSQYGEVTLDNVDGFGLVKLNGTTVSTVHLTGSLITQYAAIGTLNIIGEANLKDSTVEKGGVILGSLQAVRTTFKGPITIHSQKALFTASKLEGITVQVESGFKGKQIIELKQGTIINGPIHFDSGRGEVIIFPGCQVLGTVTGGKIVKKS